MPQRTARGVKTQRSTCCTACSLHHCFQALGQTQKKEKKVPLHIPSTAPKSPPEGGGIAQASSCTPPHGSPVSLCHAGPSMLLRSMVCRVVGDKLASCTTGPKAKPHQTASRTTPRTTGAPPSKTGQLCEGTQTACVATQHAMSCTI